MDFHIQSSLLFYFAVNIYSILGQDKEDNFFTSVKIDPPNAVKGDVVKFTCRFKLINGKDLHLLYWETTGGKRLFTYNHQNKNESEHEPYKRQKQLKSYQYFEDDDDDRRHELKMKVDICDGATYRCLVLNQVDFEEGSDQQHLEMPAYLPNPTISLEIDGRVLNTSTSLIVPETNGTTINELSCSVKGSTVQPEFTVTINDTEINGTSKPEKLDDCPHNRVFTPTKEIVVRKGVCEIFRCVASYGEEKRFTQIGINCEDKCSSNPCTNNGTCIPIEAEGYTCQCQTGFYGTNCEINPCETSPCQNGGACVPTDNAEYNCTCPENYHGNMCQNTACVDNNCHYNATCVPNSNGHYECRCHGNQHGNLCIETVGGSEDSNDDWILIVIIIVVAVFVILLIAIGIVCYYLKKNNGKDKQFDSAVIPFHEYPPIREEHARNGTRAQLRSNKHSDVIRAQGPSRSGENEHLHKEAIVKARATFV